MGVSHMSYVFLTWDTGPKDLLLENSHQYVFMEENLLFWELLCSFRNPEFILE